MHVGGICDKGELPAPVPALPSDYLTFFQGHPTYLGTMSRRFQFAALFLLALWLPATMHCALESAGLIFTSSLCADGSNDHCAGDNCTQLEDGLFKQQTDELQVMSPDQFVCDGFLCLHLPPVAALAEPIVQPSDQPQNWVTTWHFVRRAAPSPRAPSLFLA